MSDPIQSSKGATAYHQLAGVWQLRGKTALAIEAYKNALRADPGYIPSCLELSALLLERGEGEAARTVCQRALETTPDDRLLLAQVREIERRISGETLGVADSLPRVVVSSEVEVPAEKNGKSVLVYSDCSGMDGAEQCSHIIALDLLKGGYRVDCAQPQASHPLIEERERKGVRHFWIPPEDLYEAPGALAAGSAREDAKRIMVECAADLVFFSDGSPFSNLAAKKAAGDLGIPYLVLTHCVTIDWKDQHAARLEDLRRVFEGAAEVVSVSLSNLHDLRGAFGLPESKGRVIYNGRPRVFFEEPSTVRRDRIRAELGISAEAVVCVTVARMEVMKGYQYILGAMERLKASPVWGDIQFVWVGVGTLENRFKARAAELGLGNAIHFLGSRPDVPDLLEASDIFLLPSQYEGMPLSVIEAMAKGLPVAATRVSGIPEALGDTGYLIPDPRAYPEEAIAEIAKVLEDWARRIKDGEQIGRSGKERACELFSTERMLLAYRELVESCLSGRSREAGN